MQRVHALYRKYKRCRYHQLIKIAIVRFLMQYGCGMQIGTGRQILVVRYPVMEKGFGCAAHEEQYQQEGSKAFLYEC